MQKFEIIFCTVPSNAIAKQISQELVSQRAAACCTILPAVQSVYRWKEEIEQTEEYLLIIKTHANNFSKVEKLIRANHPYEVPEIIAMPISQGTPAYLDWIQKETE